MDSVCKLAPMYSCTRRSLYEILKRERKSCSWLAMQRIGAVIVWFRGRVSGPFIMLDMNSGAVCLLSVTSTLHKRPMSTIQEICLHFFRLRNWPMADTLSIILILSLAKTETVLDCHLWCGLDAFILVFYCYYYYGSWYCGSLPPLSSSVHSVYHDSCVHSMADTVNPLAYISLLR